MHLSLPNKSALTKPAMRKPQPMSRTAKLLLLYVVTFLLCVALSACNNLPQQRPQVTVAPVVQPDKVKVGPMPAVVAETEPKPPGYFQQRRLDRETTKMQKMTTPTTPTSSTELIQPAAPTR